MNIPNLKEKIPEIVAQLKQLEADLTIYEKPAPPAYLIITNHSYIYSLENPEFERMGFAYGFKIPDFYNIYDTVTLRESIDSREKHKEIEHLIKCSKEFCEIPCTFDGEIPLFAFKPEYNEQRLLVGNRYIIPDENGIEVIGILESAVVMENSKEAWGTYLTEKGHRVNVRCPISEEELFAYKQNPETFFGVPLSTVKKTENELELYDFFYNSYKNSTREKIIALLKVNPSDNKYQNMSKEELLKTLCEGFVYGELSTKQNESILQ